jgi:hypothetical protein
MDDQSVYRMEWLASHAATVIRLKTGFRTAGATEAIMPWGVQFTFRDAVGNAVWVRLRCQLESVCEQPRPDEDEYQIYATRGEAGGFLMHKLVETGGWWEDRPDSWPAPDARGWPIWHKGATEAEAVARARGRRSIDDP